MPEKNQSCSTCYFFYITGTNENNGEIGYCRANPPQPYYNAEGKPQVARFPIVLGNLWCGMWDATDSAK